jgi:hypothetical protein
MKEHLSQFSEGKVKRKFKVVEKRFNKAWTVVVALSFIMSITLIVVIGSNFPFAILLSVILLVLILPKLSRYIFPYNETGEILWFDSEKIELRKGEELIWTQPTDSLQSARVSIGIESIPPANPLYANPLRTAIGLNIRFKFKNNATATLLVLNELYQTKKDLNEFKSHEPNLFGTLEILRDKFAVKLYNKKGETSNWI